MTSEISFNGHWTVDQLGPDLEAILCIELQHVDFAKLCRLQTSRSRTTALRVKERKRLKTRET
jgi:hypothetical protein